MHFLGKRRIIEGVIHQLKEAQGLLLFGAPPAQDVGFLEWALGKREPRVRIFVGRRV
jgi:hypothetical protein